MLGVVILYLQLSLGGWTSANYAAVACVDFPTCLGQWWPVMNFEEAFVLWRESGINYEGGVLSHEARTAIHMTHRLGALVTFLYLGTFALASIVLPGNRARRGIGVVLLAVLLAQIGLGIANVLLALPLPVAVAHNGVAALLLLTLLTLNHVLNPRPPQP